MADNGVGIKIGLDLQTNQGIKDFNAWSNKVNAIAQKNPIKINVNLDGQKWEKTIQTFVAKNGDLVESTRYVNTATKEEYEQITKVESGFSRLQKVVSQQATAQSKLNTTTQQSVNIFNDFAKTFMKMAKFNTVNLIYDGLINKMSEAIQITNDFDKAMVEFKKVTDTSNLSLSEYTETLGQYGESVARTTTEMLESATEFSKAGFTPEDSARLAQVSSLFQNIADSEVSAGDAASFIISQMKAFNIEADDATSILDKVNEVKLFVTSLNRVNCGELPMIFVSYNVI